MKKLWDIRSNRNGSALLAVTMVITVVIVLGLGIFTLSTANLQQNEVDDTYERDYYSADGGAKQAVEALKSYALERYNLIAIKLKNGLQEFNAANYFFSDSIDGISGIDGFTYIPPQPDSSAGGPTTLTVSVAHTVLSTYKHRYTITSTATDGKTPRRIIGSIDISFVPFVVQSSALPFPADATMCGGTFNMANTSSSVNLNITVNGNVQFGAYNNPNTSIYYDGFSATNKNATGWVDSSTANTVKWDLVYSNLKPAKASGTLTVPASSSISGTFSSPVYLEGLPSSDLAVTATITGGGQIYSYKGLSLSGGDKAGTSSNYLTIFCSGDLSIGSVNLNYCKIYCDGNVTMGNGSISNTQIYCGGNMSLGAYSYTNCAIVSGNTVTMGNGSLNSGCLVYAANDIYIVNGASSTAILYAKDDIYINAGGSMSGQMVAGGDINTKSGCSYTINYDSSVVNNVLHAPYIGSIGGTGSQIIPPTDSVIYGTTGYLEQ